MGTRTKLHWETKRVIKSLVDATGHQLQLEDFSEIAQINELQWDIADPRSDENEGLLALPTRAGNVVLHPLTLGRAKWLDDVGLPWFKADPYLAEMMLGFVLSRRVDLDEMWRLDTRKDCKREVIRWFKKADCTFAELNVAVVKMVGANEDDAEEQEDAEHKPADYGPLIGMLCREYGQSPRYWLWDAAAGEVNTLANEYVCRVEAEEEAARTAAGPNAGPPPVTNKNRKIKRMLDMKNALRKQWLTKTSTLS